MSHHYEVDLLIQARIAENRARATNAQHREALESGDRPGLLARFTARFTDYRNSHVSTSDSANRLVTQSARRALPHKA